MHTAQIANLPPHPTPAETRQESHGDDFTIHLREETREVRRQDEPRSPVRDEPDRTKSRPRASEENHQRLPSDDRSDPVAQSKNTEEPAAPSDGTDLPRPDTEGTDTGPSLDGSEGAPQPDHTQTIVEPSAVETAAAPKLAPDPAFATENSADGETNAADLVTATASPASAMTETAETVAGAEPAIEPGIPASSTGEAANEAVSVSDILAATSDANPNAHRTVTPSTGSSTITSAPDGSGQPATPAVNVTPQAVGPAEVSTIGQAATTATVAATGLRAGAGATGQTAGSNAMPNDIAENAMSPSDGEDTGILNTTGAANKASGTSATANQSGQPIGTAANAEASAGNLNPTDGNPKDLTALKDMPVRGNDLPAQTTTSVSTLATTGSVTANANTFGSELRLSADASPTSQTAAARNLPNAAANQVAVQINRAVLDGQDKFVVNLKPATLGKVSVQLEVGHDNRVIAVIAAERPDTLELLQRDSRALELALKDAGLKTDSGSLSFNLQGNGTEDPSSDTLSETHYNLAIPQGDDELDTLPNQLTHTYAANASGVDIHV